MEVREAFDSDIPAILAIWNPAIRDTLITFNSQPKTPENLAEALARNGAFLVAEDAGALLGFATFFPFRTGPGYAASAEHTIMLSPDARGRGVGRALMAELEARTRAQGIHVLVASVTAANPAGVRFHEALGFVETGRMPEVGRKFGRWQDLVLMQKIL